MSTNPQDVVDAIDAYLLAQSSTGIRAAGDGNSSFSHYTIDELLKLRQYFQALVDAGRSVGTTNYTQWEDPS